MPARKTFVALRSVSEDQREAVAPLRVQVLLSSLDVK